MHRAYTAIFTRLGLKFRSVVAVTKWEVHTKSLAAGSPRANSLAMIKLAYPHGMERLSIVA